MSEAEFKRGDKVWVANLWKKEIIEASILQENEDCKLPGYFLESTDGDTFCALDLYIFKRRDEAEKCLVDSSLERIEAFIRLIRQNLTNNDINYLNSIASLMNENLQEDVSILKKILWRK